MRWTWCGRVVIQVRKRNLVLGADRLPDDDLVNVVEFIPVFILGHRIKGEQLSWAVWKLQWDLKDQD